MAGAAQDRSGFQRMVAEAALGNVGVILALEVSRLSRGNRDWYHLLGICAVTETRLGGLGDGEDLYDPGTYNDRLLLGLKGIMSEAELHIMKQRLVEAMRVKGTWNQVGRFSLMNRECSTAWEGKIMPSQKRMSPVLVFLFALWFSWSSNDFLQAQSDLLVIFGGNLVDGNGGPPLKDTLLIISQGRIQQISQVGKIPVPTGAQVIDATGKTLLPGFIDGHVHFREWHGELYLANGVTTVVDTGDPDEWTQALMHGRNLGKIRTPRIFGSGVRLGAEVSIRRKDLVRPVLSPRPHFLYISLEEAKRRIHEKKKMGMPVIKVDETWTKEHLEELARLAHSLDLPIIGHSNNPRDSANSGLNAIFHFWGILPGIVGGPAKLEALRKGQIEDIWSVMDPATFPELINLLVSKKVIVDAQPVLDGPMRKQDQYELDDYKLLAQPELQYVPLLARVAIFRKHYELRSKTPLERESFQKYQRFLKEFAQAGGRLMAGTDTIVSAVPGVALRRNLVALQEAGIDRMTILQAATKNPAELYQLKDLGTLEPRKLADIQIVYGSPLDGLSNLERIEKVIIGGMVDKITASKSFSSVPTKQRATVGQITGSSRPSTRITMRRTVARCRAPDSLPSRTM